MQSTMSPPQIIFSSHNDNTAPITSPTKPTNEGEILIHFPDWTNYAEGPMSPNEVDFGINLDDYSMVILTCGAARGDPVVAIAPRVHVVYPENAKRTGTGARPQSGCVATEERASWRLSSESDSSDGSDSSGTALLSPVSSASSDTDFSSPPVPLADLPSTKDEKYLRRRAHLRRPSAESRPCTAPCTCTSETPSAPLSSVQSPPAPSMSAPCDPVLPLSPPRRRAKHSPTSPLSTDKVKSKSSSNTAPALKAGRSRAPSICPDSASYVQSPDSDPIDWSLLEMTLGCVSNENANPFAAPAGACSPLVVPKLKKTPPPIPPKSHLRKLSLSLDVVKEEEEVEGEQRGMLYVPGTGSTKRSRRRAALVGSNLLSDRRVVKT